MKYPTKKSYLTPAEDAALQAKYPLRPADWDMIEDEMHAKVPALGKRRRTIAGGIAAMRVRLATFRGDKIKTLNALDSATGSRRKQLLADLAQLNADIDRAKKLLKDFQSQAPAQN